MIEVVPSLFDTNHSSSSHLLQNKIFTATGLTVIEVSGQDAPKFLQGQLTCNVNDLSESQASIAAFCNAKGRVISTLVVVKIQQSFLLILPISLLDTVIKKLGMYVLRAQVKLHDQTDKCQLLGLQALPNQVNEFDWPTADFAVGHHPAMLVKLPSTPRYLLVADPTQAQELIAHLRERQGFETGDLDEWRYQDISSALPWFDMDQTEQHIPQMLNLDQLGGISFNKGCYTGQEIVARSHYLGKVKRALFVAECHQPGTFDHGCAVLDSNNLQNLGCVLAARTWAGVTRLLLVLQIVDGQPKNLILDDDHRTPLAIISDY
ncbi:folate-binding protein [Methylomonas montana]|uniref:CAF17-like 4Fe-4S cluster assembly/insertion protein YgfZ n=1 Tax=Methylomonas montana TaxID=3058963 RepID=UPI0026592033|nr:folate-binding protein [Methylomonas montana]WKJ89121.1 folate-binding protein [Methylomonas montana]